MAPHFFKIILPDTIKEGRLVIPKKFVMNNGESFPNQVFLKVPTGMEWEVAVTRCDDNVWLDKGWNEFVKYFSIDCGHFLIFRYEGNSRFYVVIFNGSATEIDYPPCKRDNEPKVVKTVKLEESTEDVFVAGGSRDFPAENGADNSNNGRKFESHRRGRKRSMISRKIDKHHKRANDLEYESPSFTITIRPSYISPGFCAWLPSGFPKEYLKKDSTYVALRVADGRTWTVTCRGGEYRKPAFVSGWKAFVEGNNLRVGDVCLFELVRGTQILKVSISRSCEVEEIPLSSGVNPHFSQPLTNCAKSLENMRPSAEDCRGTRDSKLTNGNCGGALDTVKAYDKDAKSKGPSFSVAMQPSYVGRHTRQVRVPGRFVTKYFSKNHLNVTLRRSNGRLWSLQYRFKDHEGKYEASFCCGWKAFANDNGLEFGDVCVFELVDKTENVLSVDIYRLADGHAEPPISS